MRWSPPACPALPALLVGLLLAAPAAAAAPPPAPTGLEAKWSEGGVRLSWDRASPLPMAHRVYRASLSGEFQPIALTGPLPAYLDATAQRGASYRYCVAAIDQGQEGPCSDPAWLIDPGECLYVRYSPLGANVDTQCLWTTEPPIPWPYPYCAPFGADVAIPGEPTLDLRYGCI